MLESFTTRYLRALGRSAGWLGHHGAGSWMGDRGVTTLEFAILLPVFMTFIFMIVQFALIFATLVLLDNATNNAARAIRIGTYTQSTYASALTASICNDLAPAGVTLIQNCTTQVQIYVAAAASGTPAGNGFNQILPATVGASSMTTSKATLAAKDDVLLEVGYNYPWFVFLPTVSNSMLISTVALQTEAY
jgi:Flp pilus assembly protein TadG